MTAGGVPAIKRAYLPASPDDGRRVLVDRLWPRGLHRDGAGIDEWIKEVAPSTGLRQWFGHDPARWEEFRRRYRAELAANPALERLRAMASRGKLTLIYGARDEAHNQVRVLADYIAELEETGR